MIGLVVLVDFPSCLVLIRRRKEKKKIQNTARHFTQSKMINNFRKAPLNYRAEPIRTKFRVFPLTDRFHRVGELKDDSTSVLNGARETDERVIKYFSRLVAEISEYLGRTTARDLVSIVMGTRNLFGAFRHRRVARRR